MPRKNPIGPEDLAIAQRLKIARVATGHTRRSLAYATDVSEGVLIRVELGRAPLQYHTALDLMSWLNLSPLWLGSGDGPMAPYSGLPDSTTLAICKRASFSDVFERFLSKPLYAAHAAMTSRKLYRGNRMLPAGESHYRIEEMQLLRGMIVELVRLPFPEFDDAVDKIFQILRGASEKVGPDKWEEVVRRSAEWEAAETVFSGRPSAGPKLSEQIYLTKRAGSEKQLAVKSTVPKSWKELQTSLRAFTSARGAKSQLAKELKVSRQVVATWLKKENASEPSADFCLKLLAWVTAREAKQ